MVNEKKRTVDTWKKKKWCPILADETFDNKEIGRTIALENKNVVGRTIKKSLDSLTNNVKDSLYIITFRIDKIIGGKGEAVISEMDTKPGNLKRLIRRQKSKIEDIINVETKDNHNLKLKVIFITGAKYTTKMRTEARKIIKTYFITEIKEKTLKEVWNELIYQKLSEKAKVKLTKLGFVNKIVVAKVKLIK